MTLWLSLACSIAVGVVFGLKGSEGGRFRWVFVVIAPFAAAGSSLVIDLLEYALIPAGQDWGMAFAFAPFLFCLNLILGLAAAATCAAIQWVRLRVKEPCMSAVKGVVVIALATLLFGAGGGFVGYLLGVYSPGYYRAVFPNGNDASFDPVSVGVGLGLTQGLTAGLVVGAAVVVAVVVGRALKRVHDSA